MLQVLLIKHRMQKNDMILQSYLELFEQIPYERMLELFEQIPYERMLVAFV